MVAASVVWCRDGLSRARMHSSMAACLVPHTTGIAQSPPDPFLCYTLWSQFSAHFMQGRSWTNMRNSNILLLTLEADTFQFILWNVTRNKEKLATFYTVVLCCFAINTRVRCFWYSLRNQKMWIPKQQPLHKWQVYGWSVIPYSTYSTETAWTKSQEVKVVLMWLERHWGRVGREREHKCMRHKEKLDLFFCKKILIGFCASVAPN